MRASNLIILVILIGAGSAAAAADQQPICPDRPSRSTGTCTVPVGHWQVETGLIDWTHDHSDGITSDTTIWGASLIKYGVSDTADVELGVTPLETLRVRAAAGTARYSSFGDIFARIKYRLTADNAPIEVALDPYVKIPTANRHLGNGKVEAGMLVATSAQLGKSGLTLSLDPELDWLADSDGHGHHAATQQVINLGAQLNDRLNVSAELWGQWDWDPAGTGKQVSADGSIAYLLNSRAQLDAGANFGLNKQTPGVELYTGISLLF